MLVCAWEALSIEVLLWLLLGEDLVALRLVCILHWHLLVVEHLLWRLLETGMISCRLEGRHRNIQFLRILLLHTVICATLGGTVTLRLHHIVSIEVIANVDSAIAWVRNCLWLLWSVLLVGLGLILLLFAPATSVALTVRVGILIVLLLIVTLISLWLVLLLILLCSSTLLILLLLFGNHLLLHE